MSILSEFVNAKREQLSRFERTQRILAVAIPAAGVVGLGFGVYDAAHHQWLSLAVDCLVVASTSFATRSIWQKTGTLNHG